MNQLRNSILSSIVSACVPASAVLAVLVTSASASGAPSKTEAKPQAKNDSSHAHLNKHAETEKPSKPKWGPSKKVAPSAARESVKKIVRTPDEPHAQAENEPAVDSAPIIKKASISTSPAPGSSEASVQLSAANTTKPTDHAPGKASEKVRAKPAEKVEPKSAPTPVAPTSSAPAGEPVAAETSLRWLTNGNLRYQKKNFRGDGRMPADRERTAAAQKPHAIVLSCSDSRVAPEIVFDQGIGEIFTVRVLGEALDGSVIASIEDALQRLGSKLLIVMGHTKCDAVDMALKIKDGDSSGSDAIDELLGDIRPRLKTVMTEARSANLEIEATLNADGVARELVKRSELVRKRVEAGELVIKPALYWIDSGKVRFY